MKLSELINKATEAIKKYGDMEVFALVNYDEECEQCSHNETHNKSGPIYMATTCNAGCDNQHFTIDAIEE